LAKIWLAIAADASDDVATRFVAAIERHFEPLRTFPNTGALRDHLLPGLRVVFHQRYAIYYQPHPDAVFIVRVVHSARDITPIFESGGIPDD